MRQAAGRKLASLGWVGAMRGGKRAEGAIYAPPSERMVQDFQEF